ncbi:DEP domain-containing protein DDB_G0279099-like isoform X4 [Anneissia japonica]|uniref:DEP domain-containing protein DDB_G0279099-like isoform X4 n=1 Tax=Anneissia japonica TaxID=1529436 RepID=UPI0014258335|nr:DEP domain-containing protein DDB_G0279099-like isoform X4 [Anneissia japonica]
MGCVEAKQFKHTVKPANVVVADTNERSQASARRKKKVEEQHKRSQSAAKSISNVALQNSEKLSTATNRSRKSFMSDLLVLNEANQQNVDSSKTNETEKPSTSQTLLPTSNNSSPEDNSTWDEMTNQTPDKQKEQNSKMSRTKTVAFEEPLKNKKNDSSMISKNMRDENENDEETNLATGSTNSTASLQKVQCISNGDST